MIEYRTLHQEIAGFIVEQIKHFFDQIIPKMRMVKVRN
ncbi:Uncharacterised protein [Vibrio cholerae]|nr:Uncharacterised protein [Vibrio cholerae]CSH99641.1 Uncharacterised protein [Vibrio cholerae]